MAEKKKTTKKKTSQTKKEDSGSTHTKKASSKKKQAKSTTKKEEKAQPESEESTVRYKRRAPRRNIAVTPIVVGLIVIAIIGGLFWAMQSNTSGEGTDTASGEVVAEVNGEPITLESVKSQYENMPAFSRRGVSYEMILNRSINEKLLMQKAEEKGYQVTDQEVDAMIDQLLQQRGMSREQFEQQIQQRNMSIEDVKDDYRKALVIQQLLNETVMSQIDISQEELQEYYEEHKNESPVYTEQQVRVRHILVNESDTAEEVKGKLGEGESFEALAQEYSIDEQSAAEGGDLGYISKGRMVPAFESVVFNMSVDEDAQIVQTRFGYHIVDVTGTQPAETKELSEVADKLQQQLAQQKQQELTQQYIEQLRSEGDVTVQWDKLPEEPQQGQQQPQIQLQ